MSLLYTIVVDLMENIEVLELLRLSLALWDSLGYSMYFSLGVEV
jgi:hypothetical protein